ncbi:hypothetical protein H4R27_004380 [Coemansia aciculifera]|nr:hypothetical protein H4R27_004380 [Coemansia aciculifera]
MALSPSLFQTLPVLVVRKVVEYLEERPRDYFDLAINEHNRKKAVLTPLLLVSECWRTVALVSICDNCELTFDRSRKALEATIPAWPADFSLPGFRKAHLVKRVVVAADLWKDMCDGAFCNTMSMVLYEAFSFPCAAFLELELYMAATDDSRSVSEIGKGGVVRFARSLLRLTPAVAAVAVNFLSVCTTHPDTELLYSTLVSELCQGNVNGLAVYSVLGSTPPEMDLNGVTGLTSITQGPTTSCAAFTQLAYLNARTLKTLDIEIADESDWLNLIDGGTEIPAIYNNLTLFTLEVLGDPYDSVWMEIKDVAPFPSLSVLAVRGNYPFDDDLFFRGNGATMQSLRLPFSAIARNILSRFSVFQRSGVMRMNQVIISEISDDDNRFLAENADVSIRQQMHSILEVTATLHMWNDAGEYRMFYAIKDAPSTANLQYLYLADMSCNVDNIINLVVALSSLVSISCNLRGVGPSIEAIPENKRPSSLRSKYYPLNVNYRKLRVLNTGKHSAEEIAYAAMLIAVLCPNFVHVDLPFASRKVFGREIVWAAFHGPFKPYADVVTRLVYVE